MNPAAFDDWSQPSQHPDNNSPSVHDTASASKSSDNRSKGKKKGKYKNATKSRETFTPTAQMPVDELYVSVNFLALSRLMKFE